MTNSSLELFSRYFKEAVEASVRVTKDGSTEEINPSEIISGFMEKWIYGDDHLPCDCPVERINGPIFFLYLKNLSITNAQIIECRALIRDHTYCNFPSETLSIRYMHPDEFSSFLENCWYSFFESRDLKTSFTKDAFDSLIDEFIAEFGASLYNIIVIDDFFTSTIAHIPPNIGLDLKAVVGRSGYIHSAGRRVYLRAAHNVDATALNERIDKVFLQYTQTGRTLLVPYAEELFAEVDKTTTFSGRNGLFETQFRLSKHFVGRERLSLVLQQIKERHDKSLYIPTAEEIPSIMKEEFRPDSDEISLDQRRSIFFIMDRNFSIDEKEGSVYAGETTYFICYLQLLKNGNPLLEVKERKIGWEAPVTLPHTLSTALLNISMSGRANRFDHTRLYDPFCGSGTTLMDAALAQRGIETFGSDLSPMAANLLHANLALMSQNASTLNDYRRFFTVSPTLEEQLTPKALLKILEPPLLTTKGQIQTGLDSGATPMSDVDCMNLAIKLLCIDAPKVVRAALEKSPDAGSRTVDLIEQIVENGISQDAQQILNHKRIAPKACLAFYAMRRALISHLPLSIFEKYPVFAAISKEFAAIYRELTAIKRFRDRAETADSTGVFSVETGGQASLFKSALDSLNRCSKEEFVKLACDTSKPRATINVCAGNDSIEILSQCPNSFDIIITDPPYGFNVEGDAVNYLRLYKQLIKVSISALRAHGQLLLILPQFSRNGKEIPFFQTRDFVVGGILDAAAQAGRQIYRDVHLQQETVLPYKTPYYWKSARGVSRTVVHFRFL